jgi:heme/copper-type cytochrome/quinol oxidase subunit 1
MYNEKLAKVHFWWAVISVNVLFFPQHFLGTNTPIAIAPKIIAVLTAPFLLSSIKNSETQPQLIFFFYQTIVLINEQE